ncbi:Non-catalytic module family DOC2 [Piromyces sp. E2]|nr:Non-catalytic module family DOC2 [Piromyces sp. E2]|eukprot:OUM67153.1 Non-catalytic module family DOC2 [Piromyces sp. E2]
MKLFLALSLFFAFVFTVNSEKTKCWKGVLEIGYECCDEPCTVILTDKDGDWGIQNDKWCGCGGGGELEESYNKILEMSDCFDSYECWKNCEVPENDIFYYVPSGLLYYYPSGTDDYYELSFSCYPEDYETKYQHIY